MKTLALCTLALSAVGIRLLRWLAFLQQKEYRFDRLWLFMRSAEGKAELLRCIPKKSDFSRLGCKRPALTARMLVVIFLLVLVTALGAATVIWYSVAQEGLAQGVVFFLIYLLFILIAAPLVVGVAALPTVVLAHLVTLQKARAAYRRITANKAEVIGITGSYGKSSTKALLAHVLSSKYSVFATPKSYNTLLSISQSILSGYTNQEIAIIEYGAYVPGEIKRVAQHVPPTAAIITGFAPQHLGLFGSEAAIQQAKSELVAAVPSTGVVLYNASSPGAAKIVELGRARSEVEAVPVVWKKLFTDVTTSKEGRLSFVHNGVQVQTKLIGAHYIENCALVWEFAKKYLSDEELREAFSSFSPSSMYVSTRTHKSGALLIDDGKSSNPEGFLAALTLLEGLKGRQKVVITAGIVDLGSASDAIHAKLALRMKEVANTVCYVGESGKDVVQSVLPPEQCLTDRKKIETMLYTLDETTIVLLEGRMPPWLHHFFTEKTEKKE